MSAAGQDIPLRELRPANSRGDTVTDQHEPDNHTAVIDRFGDTWIRVDEHPGQYGTWWPLTDGPQWEPRVRNGVGVPTTWDEMWIGYRPFVEADPERATAALERVLTEVAR